jgi:magnesium-transporting ATPase (P-type)
MILFIILWLIGSLCSYFIFRYLFRKKLEQYLLSDRWKNIVFSLIGSWAALLVGAVMILFCIADEFEDRKVKW